MLSDDEILQRAMPGSSRILKPVLCPRCGWHFDKGLSDPSGKHVELVPGMFTICGKCLASLRTNEDCLFVRLTPDDVTKLTPQEREDLATMWCHTYIARRIKSLDPDPKEPMQ